MRRNGRRWLVVASVLALSGSVRADWLGLARLTPLATAAPTAFTLPFADDFSTDQGWTGYSPDGWQRGPAVGSDHDPASDHTGLGDNYVAGFLLGQDYPDNLSATALTSPALDCTGQSAVQLSYWRWLGVEHSAYDHASVNVSNDGVNWVTVWENPNELVQDTEWVYQAFDISDVAAGQPTVYVQFVMGPTDESVGYGGWNLDDVQVTASQPDLTVSALSVPTTPLALGQTFSVQATVANSGLANVLVPFSVSLYLNRSTAPPPGTAPSATQTVQSLTLGQTRTLTFSGLSYSSAGSKTLWVLVDAGAAVTEAYENNNTRSASLSVVALNDLVASDDDSSRVTLTWTPVAGATGYSVYRGDTSDFAAAALLGTATGGSYADTGAPTGVTLWYWLQVQGGGSAGAYSNSDTGRRTGSVLADATAVVVPGGGSAAYNVSLSGPPAGELVVDVGRQSGSSQLEVAAPAAGWRVRSDGSGSAVGEVSHPFGVAIDTAGNVWVADSGNHRLACLAADGTWSVVGSQGTDPGQFNWPEGVATDAAGNLWVADTGNHRIQQRAANGVWTSYGTFGDTFGEFFAPCGVAADNQGNVWVADTNNDRLQRLDADGNWTVFGGTGATVGLFNAPSGVAADANGNVWVTDTGNNRVQCMDVNGAWTASGAYGVAVGNFKSPFGVAVDAAGAVWVADAGNVRLQRRDPSGSWSVVGGLAAGSGPGLFNTPNGMAPDAGGNLWVVDSANSCLQCFGRGLVFTASNWSQPQTVTLSAPLTATPGATAIFRAGATGWFPVDVQATVAPANRPPVNQVPGDQTTPRNTPLVLAGATALGVTDADAGSAALRVTLFATNGSVALGSTAGLSFDAGHPNGGPNPSFVGRLVDLNAALATVTFTPRPGFLGLALLQLCTDDLGNWGSGGPRQAVNTLRVWVVGPGAPVTAWGDNTYSQCKPPTGLNTVVAVAAGQKHTLALTAAQAVVAWGNNGSGQCTVPAALSGVVAVAAGAAHSLALKADGTVVAWGSNGDGQATVPAGLSQVVAIAAGWAHSAALKADGSVVCWGNNRYGQTSQPSGGPGLVAGLAAGSYHTLAVRHDGTVVGWGQNYSHQLDVPAGLSPAVALAGGDSGSLALLGDGSSVGWGTLAGRAGTAQALAAAGAHALALAGDGTVAGWGSNTKGESTPPAGLAQVSALAAGTLHSVAVAPSPPTDLALTPATVNENQPSGTVVGTLSTTDPNPMPSCVYQLVSGTGGDDNALFAVAGSQLVTASVLAVSTRLIRVRSTDAYGLSCEKALTVAVVHPNQPPTLSLPASQTVAQDNTLTFAAASGNAVTLADADAGTGALRLTLFATNGTLTLGSTSGLSFAAGHANGTANPVVTGSLTNLNAALAGLRFVPRSHFTGLALLQVSLNDLGSTGAGGALQATGTVRIWVGSPGGRVVAWGDNTYAQVNVPSTVVDAVSVAGGQKHTLVLRATQVVSAYGSNSSGQCGVPSGLSGVVAIAAGYSHSLALKADGTVVGWGANGDGQSTVPAGLTDVVAIAAGWAHSVALKGDGTVVCWGNNRYAQTTLPSGLGTVAGVGVGGYHTLAVRNDGTVAAWGQNANHQVDGAAAVTGALAATGGATGSVAWLGDGSVTAWGGLTGVAATRVALAASGGHALALNPDGTVTAWGSNTSGESTLPAGLANVVAVAAGVSHSVAVVMGPNLPPALTVPGTQTCAAGGAIKFTGVTASDSDAGTNPLRLTLFATHGTLTLGTTSGLAFAAGHANGGANPVVTGNLTSLNAALANLTFTPRAGFGGLGLVQLTVDDQGYTGSGGPQRVTRTIRVWVTSTGGGVVGWGDNTYGQVTFPTSLVNAIGLAAGQKHTLVLRASQAVLAYGSGGSGQTSIPAGVSGTTVALAAGYAHSLALKADGTVVGWGSNSDGQATPPAGLADVVAIAAGWAHSVALKGDGTVVCWGNNRYAQSTPPASGLGVVAAIGVGGYHTLAVRNDGTVVGWGQDYSGQVSGASAVTGVVAVTGGATSSLALRTDGSVTAWGSGLAGAAGPCAAVSALDAHAVALTTSRGVTCFGGNTKGEGSPPALAQVVAVAAGQYHSAAITQPSAAAPSSALLSVSLTASPVSPQPVGGTITLTAVLAQAVAGAEYRFRVSTDGGATSTVLRDWAGDSVATWLPKAAQTYTLLADVQANGVTATAATAFLISSS